MELEVAAALESAILKAAGWSALDIHPFEIHGIRVNVADSIQISVSILN